jgi:hypothetical protein
MSVAGRREHRGRALRGELFGNGRVIRTATVGRFEGGEVGKASFTLQPGDRTQFYALVDGQQSRSVTTAPSPGSATSLGSTAATTTGAPASGCRRRPARPTARPLACWRGPFGRLPCLLTHEDGCPGRGVHHTAGALDEDEARTAGRGEGAAAGPRLAGRSCRRGRSGWPGQVVFLT